MRTKIEDGGLKYEESYKISKVELREFLRKVDTRLFANKLTVEGEKVLIPGDKELTFKIKYDVDDNYSLTIKVVWEKNPENI